MIYVIGNPTEWIPEYQPGKWEDFASWLEKLPEVEFDIETNPSDWWCDKQVITVQFGWAGIEWVLQWSELTDEQKAFIKSKLEDKKLCKLIHNAQFECVVMLFHGIRVQNVYDTMLAEMVLQGGEHEVGYGLDDVCFRYLLTMLDKSQQTAFGDNILTSEKVIYAAQDVKHLANIRTAIRQQAIQLNYDTFDKVVELENNCVPAFAEMVYHGMEIDQPWWRSLQAEAEPLVAAAQEKLNEWLKQEPFYSKAIELGYISIKDRLLLNWNSPKQKDQVFADIYPELPGTSKAVLKRWQSDKLKAGLPVPSWLPYYLDGDTSEVTKDLMEHHRDYLITNHQLIPAETPSLNWGSTDQVLPLVKLVEPQVKDLSKETKGRCAHPIVADLDDYLDTLKLIGTYGEAFLTGNPKAKDSKPKVEPDGKVRTSFTQVMTTGRVSSKKPNMQNIPAKETVGNKYRNAFIPEKGWVFVSSDYVSQELINIAYLSKDPVWIDALSKGQDLHSVAAELVYGKKWREAAEQGCAYYQKNKQKCSCKRHKYLRTGVKSINFGLAYGMSHFKLASELRITVPEAKKLIEDYFNAFPGLKSLLDYFGRFGVEKGYIQTIKPLYRRRWFPNHKFYTRFIDAHLQGAQYHGGLGEIERASKNMPIQGTAADSMKEAVIRAYNYIHDNQLQDKVHMKMQVHDQLDCEVVEDFAQEWKIIQTKLLEDAALVFIPTGLLKAETTITPRWSK